VDRARVVVHLSIGDARRDAGDPERAAFARNDANRLEARDEHVARGDVGAAGLDRHDRATVVQSDLHAQVEPPLRIAADDHHAPS
jgi:hypothetical protein